VLPVSYAMKQEMREAAVGKEGEIPGIVERVRDHARRTPQHIAVHFGDEKLTFADIEDRSNRVANALLATGVAAQSRIAVLAKNTPVFYDLLLGAAKVDVVLVPVNYRLSPIEIAFILNDSNAELLFVSQEFASSIERIRDKLTSIREVLLIDGPAGVTSQFVAWRDWHSARKPEKAVASDAITVQMYTSGTTGRPKGALLTHDNVLQSLCGGVPVWGPWHDRDVILVCMPQYHIGASIWGIAGLWLGVESVLTTEFNTAQALSIIEKHRITKVQLASVMMKMMMDDANCSRTDFSSLELIVYGAAPASLSLVRRAQQTFGCGIAQGYGMTETAGTITYLSPEDHASASELKLKSAGRQVEGVEIRVVGPDGSSLPSGSVGEIVCQGRQVTQGYWMLPEATAEAIQDGWFHTGDAGYIDENGYLFVCDRVKDMIVSGGENIYPAEVESVLQSHPDVADVAVIGVPDERWGEAVKAIVVGRPGADLRQDQLIEFARSQIAHFKAPRSVDFVDALPRNASGKILKRELRKPFWESRDSKVV
jgi:acyl-CoA synthetase (AMP-forming)/AMP-acid ligase II